MRPSSHQKKRKHVSALTPERMEKAALREWSQPKRKKRSPRKRAKSVENLTGPKTVEGKLRALENLRPVVASETVLPALGATKSLRGVEEMYLLRSLPEDEKRFFEERKARYLDDYDLNRSADLAVLHQVLIEEIIQYRLFKRKAEKPTADLDRELNDNAKRLREALEALGMLRKQRIGVNINVRNSIAELALRFEKEFEQNAEMLGRFDAEEREMLERKRKRETVVVDAEPVSDTAQGNDAGSIV